MSELH